MRYFWQIYANAHIWFLSFVFTLNSTSFDFLKLLIYSFDRVLLWRRSVSWWVLNVKFYRLWDWPRQKNIKRYDIIWCLDSFKTIGLIVNRRLKELLCLCILTRHLHLVSLNYVKNNLILKKQINSCVESESQIELKFHILHTHH